MRCHLSLSSMAASAVLAAMLAGALAGAGRAGATEIADAPLITSPDINAKPNLMFVLDDSGSMAWSHMPDDMDSDSQYGYYASQCNGLAFNPATTYDPPVKADGSSYAASSFTAAKQDGFAASSSTTDLSTTTPVPTTVGSTTSLSISSSTSGNKTFTVTGTGLGLGSFAVGISGSVTAKTGTRTITGKVFSWVPIGTTSGTLTITIESLSGFGSSNNYNSWTITGASTTNIGDYYYYTYSGSQPAMGWTYGSSNGKVDTSTTFYKECTASESNSSSVFTKVYIKDQDADAKKNYANWYSYYHTRTLLMRTAVGRAFAALDDRYRVGFSTINSSTDAATGTGFQPVGDFKDTQRTTLYTKLYGAGASGGTPLRGALSKIGRYYANKAPRQSADPMQYACQRNFVLLTTDGYWNNGGTGGEGTNYGPYTLSSSNVGNQDGSEVRPMKDAGTAIYTRYQYSVASTKYTNSSCTKTNGSPTTYYYKVTTTTQTSTDGSTWSNGSSSTSCSAGDTSLPLDGGSNTVASLAGRSGTSVPEGSTTGGSSDTLADVAEYFYKTDLRTDALGNCTSSASGAPQNVCDNIVPEASDRDSATHQHLTTFTVGLGVSGTLTYDPDYLNQTAGDYVKLKNGTANWPNPTTTITGSSGDARNIDDLWHAAVNGRGRYYSALNATQLASAISGVLSTISATTGSSSAATTSTLELVSGSDNLVYSASYTTQEWSGDLKAYTLNGDTGEIGTAAVWSAQDKLRAASYDARKIYFRKPSSTARLDFTWTNLNASGYGAYFSGLCSTHSGIYQCDGLNATESAAANDGERLVNWLRGDVTFESANSALGTSQALYRHRIDQEGHRIVLGDIISGAPKYVGKPSFTYSDAGYSTFVSANASRRAVVYVAANDGMLHAFSAANDGDGGKELWAYVPTAVMQDLYLLADTNYASEHRYFVDGAPVTGDIYAGGAWKTILVGGLGKGGRSYYALDITDPANPKPLWEFTDPNLGLSYGNPVITKRNDGTWVVAFASGYNNADGQGHLFVLNANTGAKVVDISNGTGTTGDPSGLAKISGWIDNDNDNTVQRFYGGDEQGNLWRFDIDGVVAPHHAALKLATFRSSGGTPEPVTTKPRLSLQDGQPVVVVATGRYLGSSDISDTTKQSIYAVKDSLTDTSLGNVRGDSAMVRQTFTLSEDDKTATITSNPVNWTTSDGWWADLPHDGERVIVDVALSAGVLAVSTAIPSGDACQSGGSSWNYFLNVSNGSSLGNIAGEQASPTSIVVGQSFIALADGTQRLLQEFSDGKPKVDDTSISNSSNVMPQRIMWRELVD